MQAWAPAGNEQAGEGADDQEAGGHQEGLGEAGDGGQAVGAMWPAMKVAESWPPSAPPIVRMTVFMPLATPVWCGAHRLHDEVAERGEGEADADAEQRGGDQHVVGVVVGDGEQAEGGGGEGGAGEQRRRFEPKRPAIAAGRERRRRPSPIVDGSR